MRVKAKFNVQIDAQPRASGHAALEQDGRLIRIRVIRLLLDSGETKIRLENFSARTVDGVRQEFLSSMYLTNLIAAAANDVNPRIKAEREGNKYEYKANVNEMLGLLKNRMILALAAETPREQASMMREILNEAKRLVVAVRSSRNEERNEYPRDVDYRHNEEVKA